MKERAFTATKDNSTYMLVLTAFFTAIIIVMAFTPLGYIPLVVINATIIHIPVILGALFCGPKRGAFLGFVFGMTSFIKNTVMPTSLSAFVFSPILAASTIGPSGIIKSTLICFVPRILVGVTPYIVYKTFTKVFSASSGRYIGYAIAGAVGALTNTLLVMPGIYILYKDAYAKALSIDPDAVAGTIMGVISFNGVIEAIVAAVLVTAIGAVLAKITKAA